MSGPVELSDEPEPTEGGRSPVPESEHAGLQDSGAPSPAEETNPTPEQPADQA